MKLVGAWVRYEQGNKTVCESFTDVHECMSLRDKVVHVKWDCFEFDAFPGEPFLAEKKFIGWMLSNTESPFGVKKDLYVDYEDRRITPETIKEISKAFNEKQTAEAAKKVVQDKKYRDYPDEKWQPRELVALFRAINPKTMDVSDYQFLEPKNKATWLRNYMIKEKLKPEDYAKVLQQE